MAGLHFSFTLRLVYIMDTTGRRIVVKRPLFADFWRDRWKELSPFRRPV
jgi:hypothetical protein